MILSHNLKSFLKKTLDRFTFFYAGAILKDLSPIFYIIVILIIMYILYSKKKSCKSKLSDDNGESNVLPVII